MHWRWRQKGKPMCSSIDTGRESLAGLQARFSRAMLETRHALPPGLIRARRFSVHRNNLYASLTEALRARYPVILRLVGEEFFKAAASIFAAAHPPRTPVLLEYGDGFPAFLESFEPARGLPYLADVARLEWLRHAAYHAADKAPLTAADLAKVPHENAGSLIFALHPSAGLIASPYPIFSIWETNTRDGQVRPIGPELPGEAVLVVRPELDVNVLRLGLAEHAFAAALAAGQTLAQAIGQAAAHDGFDLSPTLAKLIAAGAFGGVSAGPIQPGDARHA
jgi:hypothetical protein